MFHFGFPHLESHLPSQALNQLTAFETVQWYPYFLMNSIVFILCLHISNIEIYINIFHLIKKKEERGTALVIIQKDNIELSPKFRISIFVLIILIFYN